MKKTFTIKKYEKTFTKNSLECKMILSVCEEIFTIEVFSCLENQIHCDYKATTKIFSDSGEDFLDFLERSEIFLEIELPRIEIELHRINRNEKINNILKNK